MHVKYSKIEYMILVLISSIYSLMDNVIYVVNYILFFFFFLWVTCYCWIVLYYYIILVKDLVVERFSNFKMMIYLLLVFIWIKSHITIS